MNVASAMRVRSAIIRAPVVGQKYSVYQRVERGMEFLRRHYTIDHLSIDEIGGVRMLMVHYNSTGEVTLINFDHVVYLDLEW